MRGICHLSIGIFWAVAANGQAIVEHSLANAGASAAAAGVKDTGKSIEGVFRSLNETFDKAGKAKESGNAPETGAIAKQSGHSKQSERSVVASKPVDPSQVTEGLGRVELIKRFGEPVLSFTERIHSQLVERLWYNTTATSDQLEIRLIDDKVSSVRPPANWKPEGPRN